MKQLIFKGQYGWYIIADNYKDKTDVSFINLYFPRGSEPLGQEKEKKWIDIQNMSFTSYKGKVGATIFAYTETCSPKESADNKAKVEQFIEDNNIGDVKVDISSDNLPFY